ncbi:unnamed protein product [Polarella glacialis]|uniref:Uncharacterized protein n=1 Tax=Polarella glacialis TaxID=89957 RepID=A0A813H0P5_POLGL|nr:unnamed protein product [Polarella glacialis]
MIVSNGDDDGKSVSGDNSEAVSPGRPQVFGPPEPSILDAGALHGVSDRRYLPADYAELSPEETLRSRSAEAAEAVGARNLLAQSPYLHPDAPTIGEVQRQMPKPEQMKNLVRYKGPTSKDIVLKQATTNAELQKAVEKGDAELVAAIMRYGLAKRCVNVNAPLWPKREHLLHLASRRGFRDVCVLLLEARAELNAEEITDGKHPLHEACSCGHLDVCELLLDRKAHLEEANFTGLRPLHWASFAGHRDVCDLLLDRRAKLDAASGDTREPLHHAAANGHADVVRLLCRRGAKPDVEAGGTGSGGLRPLHFACMGGHVLAAAALLDAGALGSLLDFGPDGPLRRQGSSEVEGLVRRTEQLRFRLDEAEELADIGQEPDAAQAAFAEIVAGFNELGLVSCAESARADAIRYGFQLVTPQ